jgi:hypothetical protein
LLENLNRNVPELHTAGRIWGYRGDFPACEKYLSRMIEIVKRPDKWGHYLTGLSRLYCHTLQFFKRCAVVERTIA